MADEQMITPVNHDGGSATGQTVAGAAGGGLWGGIKGAATGWVLITALGALAAFALGMFLTGAWTLTIPAILTHASVSGTGLFVAALTAAGGIGAAIFGGPIAATWGGLIGGGFGAAKGAGDAQRRVAQERQAAAEMDAQLEMIRAQSQTAPQQNNIYTAPQGGLPEQGSAMNQAASTIKTGAQNAQLMDTVNGQQLAAAR